MSTGSEPKIGDFGQAGPPGDVGKAIADGARGAQVCAYCSDFISMAVLTSFCLSLVRHW